jgi:hypothetical protein
MQQQFVDPNGGRPPNLTAASDPFQTLDLGMCQ